MLMLTNRLFANTSIFELEESLNLLFEEIEEEDSVYKDIKFSTHQDSDGEDVFCALVIYLKNDGGTE